MPGPGQKSVSLPAELVDEAGRAATERGYGSSTELIREAIREKLANLGSLPPAVEPPIAPPASAKATTELKRDVPPAAPSTPQAVASKPPERRGRQPPVPPKPDPALNVAQARPAARREASERQPEIAREISHARPAVEKAAAHPKISRAVITILERYVRRSELDPKMRDRIETHPRPWLIGMIQLAYSEKGLDVPNDEQARVILEDLRELPVIVKVLGKVKA